MADVLMETLAIVGNRPYVMQDKDFKVLPWDVLFKLYVDALLLMKM